MTPATRRSWAEVDLAALRHNVRLARSIVGPETRVAAVVKADAYGHGAVPVAQAALQAGAAALVVANAAEGAELRGAGIDAPIIIIGASLPAEAREIVAQGLECCLAPPDLAEALIAEARRQGRTARVHLMIDLGMCRAGVPVEALPELAAVVRDAPELEVAGLASHFPMADEEDLNVSREQVDELLDIVDVVREAGLEPPVLHMANSAGLLRLPDARLGMVRAGIMIYGMAGAPLLAGLAPWRPALSWFARVVTVRDVPADTPIGYGHTYRTPSATRIATLPVGYHDGYLRAYSTNASVLLHGRRAPVVGRVSMDYTTVDVGQIPGVAVGDVATLLGSDGHEAVTAEELAERRGTIPYEVTCAIGSRVARVYVDAEKGTA
jgi:alanine racemase